MDTIYIKKIDKPQEKFKKIITFISQVFNIFRIEKCEKGIIYTIPYYEKLSSKEAKRVIKKISKKINKNINIVLSEKCIKDEELLNYINAEKIKFIDGRLLFSYLIEDILEYIAKIQEKDISKYSISILINEKIENNLELIIKLANMVKSINIITKNKNKLTRLEEKLYNEQGIAINITNNRKKSLLKSDIVLNIDYDEENLNRCTFKREQIVININKQCIIKSKTFAGLNINDYEIDIENTEKIKINDITEKFSQKYIYESIINKKETYNKIKSNIKEDGLKIKYLIGINSKITEKELKNIN